MPGSGQPRKERSTLTQWTKRSTSTLMWTHAVRGKTRVSPRSLLSPAFPWRTVCPVSFGCDATCCFIKFCHHSCLNLDFNFKFVASYDQLVLQDPSGDIFDEMQVEATGNGGADAASAEGTPTIAKTPSFVLIGFQCFMWVCVWSCRSLQVGSFMNGLVYCGMQCHCVCMALIRKGPIERVSFPAASKTVSPFQQLGTYIMILGQKIDSAQVVKAGFLGWTWALQALRFWIEYVGTWHAVCLPFQEKLDQYASSNAKAKELPACNPSYSNYLILIIHGLHLCTLRLSEGINDPLAKLQAVYKKMTQMQGDSMASAPTRLAGKNLPCEPCISLFGDCFVGFVCFWLLAAQAGFSCSWCFLDCRDDAETLQKHFVLRTKEDTMMNVWLVRARSITWVSELSICKWPFLLTWIQLM